MGSKRRRGDKGKDEESRRWIRGGKGIERSWGGVCREGEGGERKIIVGGHELSIGKW